MHRILVIGAGNIGSLIAYLLAHSKDYHVYLADVNIENEFLKQLTKKTKTKYLELVSLDATNEKEVIQTLKQYNIETVVSSLPYYRNPLIIRITQQLNLHYFDLTEDVKTAAIASQLPSQLTAAVVPQCGLAPGFISIVANHLLKDFSEVDSLKMRVGALPVNVSNALQYSLTWSTDGLINEYDNPCHAIENSQRIELLPLDDIEEIKIDGLTYEAFNTSGGLGSLVNSLLGKVKELNYKTIRYPGHCEKMRFLMHDLKLNQDRETLKRILENALPRTSQDVVLIYVVAIGKKNQQYYEKNYVRKFYPQTIGDMQWSAIQVTTASALCAVLDMVMQDSSHYQGLVHQERFAFNEFIKNRFGKCYA